MFSNSIPILFFISSDTYPSQQSSSKYLQVFSHFLEEPMTSLNLRYSSKYSFSAYITLL